MPGNMQRMKDYEMVSPKKNVSINHSSQGTGKPQEKKEAERV